MLKQTGQVFMDRLRIAESTIIIITKKTYVQIEKFMWSVFDKITCFERFVVF